MSKVTSYAPGTPCWADLSCADIDASMSFYADLFAGSSRSRAARRPSATAAPASKATMSPR